MQGDITVKAPVAMLVMLVLVVSVMLNIFKFMQPAGVAGPASSPIGSTLPASAATSPGGGPDPLSHVPRDQRDAVGMPDATGGRGN